MKTTICSSISMFYYLLKQRPTKDGKFPICVRVSINGTQTAFSIKRSIHLKNWSAQANMPIGTTSEITELRSYINALNARFIELNAELNDTFDKVTAQMIRAAFENKRIENDNVPLNANVQSSSTKTVTIGSSNGILFLDAFAKFIAKENELVGIDTSQTTVNRFGLIVRFFGEFLEHKGIDINSYLLSSVDKTIILDFNHYLKTVVNNNHNTAMKKMERFRKFLKYCFDYKLLSINPFSEVRVSYKKTKRERLTEQEIQLLIDKDLSHCERLEFVRDMFVFCCFTGLAYCDMASLQRSQVERQSDGTYVIYKHRIKTDEPACMPLIDMPLSILQKYCDLENSKSDDLVFDMNTNEKMNAYLKEIAIICGIDKNLTTHVARHTCASLLLNYGVPLAVIQRMLGHANSVTTEIYAQLFGTQVKTEIQSVGNVFKTKGMFSRKKTIV